MTTPAKKKAARRDIRSRTAKAVEPLFRPLSKYFYCCKVGIAPCKRKRFRACGRDQRAFRSPFGNLRPPYWSERLQARKLVGSPFQRPYLFSAAGKVIKLLWRSNKFEQPEVMRICQKGLLQAKSAIRPGAKPPDARASVPLTRARAGDREGSARAGRWSAPASPPGRTAPPP